MRRNVRATLAVLVAVIATLAFAPSSQAASLVVDGQRYTQVSDFPTYGGWARVGHYAPAGYSPSAATVVCPQIYPSTCGQGGYHPAFIDFTPASFTFWRWSGTAWGKGSVRGGQWVWVAPYAVGWSWIWTQETGWLAAQDSQLFAPR